MGCNCPVTRLSARRHQFRLIEILPGLRLGPYLDLVLVNPFVFHGQPPVFLQGVLPHTKRYVRSDETPNPPNGRLPLSERECRELAGLSGRDFIGVGLGELLRLDLFRLRRSGQVVKEAHVGLSADQTAQAANWPRVLFARRRKVNTSRRAAILFASFEMCLPVASSSAVMAHCTLFLTEFSYARKPSSIRKGAK